MHNDGHMSSGGVRSVLLSTEVEITIELLPLATNKPRHYLYAVLAVRRSFLSLVLNFYFVFLIFSQWVPTIELCFLLHPGYE
jgi:hypothetical protein